MCDANKNPCDKKLECEKKEEKKQDCPPPAPVCEPSKPNPKDCEECQATLKAHLKTCCGYGVRPKLIEKCSDLPGGCNTPKPTNCPAPPKPACPCPPVIKCDTPKTATFSCPDKDCAPKETKPACDTKPACGGGTPAAAAPPAPANDTCAPGTSKANNDCAARPLSMTRDDGTSGCTRPNC